MNFVRLQARAQRRINALVALDRAQTFKSARDNGGVPMPTVASNVDVVARQACGDDGLKLFVSHDQNMKVRVEGFISA